MFVKAFWYVFPNSYVLAYDAFVIQLP